MSRRYEIVLITSASILVLLLAGRLALTSNGERLTALAIERFSSEILPVEIDSFRRPDVEETENAAHFVRAGSLALAATGEDVAILKELSAQEDVVWDDDDLASARRLVEQVRAGLDLFADASLRDASRSSFELKWEDGAHMTIPNLLAILHGARFLLVETRLALAEGRPEDARETTARLWTLAHVTYNEPVVIFDLIALAIERLYWSAVHETFHSTGDIGVLTAALDRAGAVSLREAYRRSMSSEAWTLANLSTTDLQVSYFGRDLTWGERYFYLPMNSFYFAQVLDYYRGSITAYDEKTAAEMIAEQEFPDNFFGPEGGLIDLGDIGLKQKAVEAQRLLAATAVEMATAAQGDGTYPGAVPGAATSPVDGGAMTWEPTADGGGVLTLSGRAFWDEHFQSKTILSPVLSWRLPPRDDE